VLLDDKYIGRAGYQNSPKKCFSTPLFTIVRDARLVYIDLKSYTGNAKTLLRGVLVTCPSDVLIV